MQRDGATLVTLAVTVVGATLVASALALSRSPADPPTPPGPAAATTRQASVNLADARIVDLTHPFDARTIYWPATPPDSFVLTRRHFGPTSAGYFYAANAFCAPEHGGTHIDAPIHFAAGRWTVDQIPLRRLIAPGVVIDISTQASADRDYRLSVEDLRRWEATRGPIPEGAIVLLRTGWSRYWGDAGRYLGDDTPGDASHLHFPSYGKEAAAFLVTHRKVSAIGTDTASIDYGPSKDFIVHRIVADANIPGLENLANLEHLPDTGAWIIALPMKIGSGSGGPLRVVAVLPR
jgi:kynurenine formamidase